MTGSEHGKNRVRGIGRQRDAQEVERRDIESEGFWRCVEKENRMLAEEEGQLGAFSAPLS